MATGSSDECRPDNPTKANNIGPRVPWNGTEGPYEQRLRDREVLLRSTSAEERPDELNRGHEDEVANRNRCEEPQRGTPARPHDAPGRAAGLRDDEPRDDASRGEDDSHVDRDEQDSQIPAGQHRAAAQRDVIGNVRDGKRDRDEEAAQHRPDDRPGRVPELPPADLRPRPRADAGDPGRAGPAARQASSWPRMTRRLRAGIVSGV